MISAGTFADLSLTAYWVWEKARNRVKKPPLFAKSRIKPVDDALQGFFGNGPKRLTRLDVFEAIAHVRRTTTADTTYKELLDWVISELQHLFPEQAQITLAPSVADYAAAYRKRSRTDHLFRTTSTRTGFQFLA